MLTLLAHRGKIKKSLGMKVITYLPLNHHATECFAFSLKEQSLL